MMCSSFFILGAVYLSPLGNFAERRKRCKVIDNPKLKALNEYIMGKCFSLFDRKADNGELI